VSIREKESSRVASDARGVIAEIGEGLRVVAAHRILRVLAGCSGTISLFGQMFLAVYVLYMTRDLGLGSVGVGFVFAAGGVGALVGAVVAAPVTKRLGPGPAMIWAQLCFGLTGMAVPLAVLVPRIALPMVVAAEFGQWMALSAYYVNAVSVRQTLAPDHLQGRVNATMRFMAGGMQPIGALLGGALGGLIGLPRPACCSRSCGSCSRRCAPSASWRDLLALGISQGRGLQHPVGVPNGLHLRLPA
jgi:MFS family permease